MKLIYAANARIPSEKAHPYQIVQMCEAFSALGAEVTLLYPSRRNPAEMRTDDIWGYYDVPKTFRAEKLACLDVYPVAERLPGALTGLWTRFAALLATLTFNLSLIIRLAKEANAVIYSRDPFSLALITTLSPRQARNLYFEAHTYPATGAGWRLRRWLAKRIGGFIVITGHLRERYAALGVPSEHLIVAHDGMRAARFQIIGDRANWRVKIGWPQDAFIVGYMGRFFTLGMGKGLDDLLDAVISLAADETARPIRLGLVGGPHSYVDGVRARLSGAGLPPEIILYAGQIPASAVPGYLRAFDVCTMPFPWTEHFAYYASPMKLFEYMASGSPILATNLPSTAEIIEHNINGLLVPPGDPSALAAALRRLRDDESLAARLASAAAVGVQHYTWEARARYICQFIEKHSQM